MGMVGISICGKLTTTYRTEKMEEVGIVINRIKALSRFLASVFTCSTASSFSIMNILVHASGDPRVSYLASHRYIEVIARVPDVGIFMVFIYYIFKIIILIKYSYILFATDGLNNYNRVTLDEGRYLIR